MVRVSRKHLIPHNWDGMFVDIWIEYLDYTELTTNG